MAKTAVVDGREYWRWSLGHLWALEAYVAKLESQLGATSTALRVIRTWATFEEGECLLPDTTAKLARDALAGVRPPEPMRCPHCGSTLGCYSCLDDWEKHNVE